MSGSRILGLDFGSKKIGVAVSDELRLTAHGLENVRARPAAKAIEVLKQLVKEYNAAEIVIGLPLNMDGTSGPGAEAARAFAARLTAELSVKVHLSDERLTTVMAEKALLEANLSREKRKKLRDRVAAVLILQNFLDQGAHGG